MEGYHPSADNPDNPKLCIVCSKAFTGDLNIPEQCSGSGLKNHPKFARFCGELEIQGNKSGPCFNAGNFLYGLGNSSNYLILCEECLELVGNTMELRGKMEEVELEVLELQVRILRKMKVLKESIRGYLEEMWKVLEKVRGTDDEEYLEGYGKEGKVDKKCDVMLFREKIMDVVAHFGIFQDSLEVKCMDSFKKPTSQKEPTSDLGPVANDGKEEDSIDFEFLNYMELEEDRNGGDYSEVCYEEIGGEGASEVEEEVPSKKRKLQKRKKKTAKNPKLTQINFKDMTPFKKDFIHLILDPPARQHFSKENEALKKLHPWDYDPLPLDKFTVSGHEVILQENEALPSVTFNCGCCPFQFTYNFAEKRIKEDRVKFVLERKIFEHVVSQHLDPTAFQCSQCPEKFPCQWRLRYHQDRHHADFSKKLSCDQCHKLFSSKSRLDSHLQWHQQGLDLVAKKRRQALKKKRDLDPVKREVRLRKQREQALDRPKSYQCTTCGSQFKNSTQLTVHEESHKDKDSRPTIVCPLCGRTLLQISYNYHKNYVCSGRSGNVMSIPCKECKKTFRTKEHLEVHVLRKHTQWEGGLPFQCDQCGKGYKVQKDLNRHRSNQHLNDKKPYACGKGCGKRYLLEIAAQKHEVKCPGREQQAQS